MPIADDNLNHDFPLKNKGYSNALGSSGLPRHRWYFIKEAFSPYIVEQALQDANCKGGEVIIDPFCGSGTVPLTTSLKGFTSLAYEVNPFLSFVTQTKMMNADAALLSKAVSDVETKANQGEDTFLEKYSTFSEAGGRKKWLFNRDVIRTFEGGWSATERLDATERDLIRLSLLGAAIDTCNATRDGKCLRYRKGWKDINYSKDDFLASFKQRIQIIKEDLVICPHKNNLSKVVLGDTRLSLSECEAGTFNLCITSPPYLNSFDYSDVYRPELFLGKYVETNTDLTGLRLQTLRSHIQTMWKDPTDTEFGPLYADAVSRISDRSDELWAKRIPLMIQAYFEDMKCVLENLKKAAKPNATVWLVVSTSAYAGIEIPVDLIIADIGEKVGWYLREVGVMRHLRSSSHHRGRLEEKPDKSKPVRLRESVVIFDATPKKVSRSRQ